VISGWRICSIALLAAAPVFGQDVSVRGYLNSNQVGVNRQFVLNVEISGTQQVDSDPAPPDLDDFAVYLSSGTSTSMQMVNGRTTLSVTLQYRYQAIKEGTFEIGPVEVQAGGKKFSTEPLTITVSSSPPPSQPRAGGAAGENVEIAPEDLFVSAEASKRSVYENEPVIVEYRIYTRVNVSSYSVLRLPGTAGFWVEEFEQPSSPTVEQVVRNGVQYATAVIRKVAMFPTGPGNKRVEPLSIQAQVQVQRRQRDLFDDFFRSPFASRVPVVVASDPIEIDVKPLPEDGKPPGFSGLVGNFDITATIDNTRASTNEALTYRLRIEGQGNLRTVPEPHVDFPSGFEVYPPEVKEQVERADNRVSGSKVYEYVLIPRTPGSKTIPSVRLDYFDVGRGTYATAVTQPIDVDVVGEAVEGPTIAGRSRGSIEQLREDIRFIRIAAPHFQTQGQLLFTQPAFWIVFLIPVGVVGGAWGFRRHRDRLEGDVAYARRRRANRVARKRLARAKSLQSSASPREFYAEIARALQGFLGDKLNLAEAGLIKDYVNTSLASRGVPQAAIDEYLGCIDMCDRQRFAPSEANRDEMKAFLKRAERAMSELGQGLAR
jgi:hypothetical protein